MPVHFFSSRDSYFRAPASSKMSLSILSSVLKVAAVVGLSLEIKYAMTDLCLSETGCQHCILAALCMMRSQFVRLPRRQCPNHGSQLSHRVANCW